MKKVWLSILALSIGILFAGSFMACGGDDEETCTPACTDKECGSDGCDGVCGTCDEAAGETCTETGMCESNACAEACTGKVCGDAADVADCSCGTCEEGFTCTAEGTCADAGDCTATCTDKCGTVDTCECGDCEAGYYCTADNACDCDAVTNCEGKECGDDGCEGNCGECNANSVCEDGMCVCTPDCDGKECGADGCGGTCGDCGDKICDADKKCQAKAEDCPPVDYEFSADTQKINQMEIGKGGHPGEALDVDNDPDTCAPADDCEGGLNNQLSGLLKQLAQFVDADAEITTALDEGQIILLSENVGLATDGSVFTINMYIGEAVADKETCDFQADLCEYVAKPDSLDPITCLPHIMFDNATITDGKLFAGGADSVFKFAIPISEGIIFDVAASMATISGDYDENADPPAIVNGLIGGAVRKDKLMEAVDLIPEDAGLPVSAEMIKNLLDMFVVPDVDTDDDGEPDAASIGVKFGTIPGTITGWEEAAAE